MEAVRMLIEQVREMEIRHQVALAIGAWTGAYGAFRQKERTLGLPVSKDGRLIYCAIVSDLRASGKALYAIARSNDLKFESLGITDDDFEAMLNMLAIDDDWAERPLDSEQERMIRAAFGESDVSAS